MTLHQRLLGKRFGCVLSAGFFGFYGHAGFLKGLAGSGLKPRAYAGTSAGGMVAAYAATGMPVHAIEELVLRQTRASFRSSSGKGLPLLRQVANNRSR